MISKMWHFAFILLSVIAISSIVSAQTAASDAISLEAATYFPQGTVEPGSTITVTKSALEFIYAFNGDKVAVTDQSGETVFDSRQGGAHYDGAQYQLKVNIPGIYKGKGYDENEVKTRTNYWRDFANGPRSRPKSKI